MYITLSFVSHNDGLPFVDIEGICIQGWRREQDVAHQSCNGGGDDIDEHGGAVLGNFFFLALLTMCAEFSSAGAHPLLAKCQPPPLPRPKSTEGAKATKKTAKTAVPADGEKKRKKEESYSSYIYNGAHLTRYILIFLQLSNRSTLTLVSPTRQWLSLKVSCERYL